jgi:hypothetical protein
MFLWNLVWGCAMAKTLSRWFLAEGGLGSYPRPVHVEYMVEIVARGRGFLPVSIIPPLLHAHTLYIRFLR